MLNYFDKLFLGRDCTDKLLKYLDENLILLKVLFSPTESFFQYPEMCYYSGWAE